MPRTCTICTHQQRQEIDQALVAGGPFRTIADQWSVSKTALIRHKDAHLPATLAKAREAQEVGRADALLSEARRLYEETLRILEAAKRDPGRWSRRDALAAVDKGLKALDLLGRLMGELQGGDPQVNILVAPQWVSVRQLVTDALAPFPEAKLAVAGALRRLGNGHD